MYRVKQKGDRREEVERKVRARSHRAEGQSNEFGFFLPISKGTAPKDSERGTIII